MLELKQQNIPKLKSEVSNNTEQEDGNNGNSYDLVFPALPDSKTTGSKTVAINGQCSTTNVPAKGWNKARPLVSAVNQVIYLIVFKV